MTPIRSSVRNVVTLTHFAGSVVGVAGVVATYEFDLSVFVVLFLPLVASGLLCLRLADRTLRRFGL